MPEIVCPVCSKLVLLTATANGYIKQHHSLIDGSICEASNKYVGLIPSLRKEHSESHQRTECK
jgi:hypothetical protein